jgi:hypothetical protein
VQERLVSFDVKPRRCTLQDVGLALSCLEDPVAYGITSEVRARVSCFGFEGGGAKSPAGSVDHGCDRTLTMAGQEGTLEPAVFLCDIVTLPGAEEVFLEAKALERLKELLWLLTPYQGLQIIIAECLLCTLHRLCDTFSQYRWGRLAPGGQAVVHALRMRECLFASLESLSSPPSCITRLERREAKVRWFLNHCRKLMVRHGYASLLVHTLECSTRSDCEIHSAFIRRASSTILARLANKCAFKRCHCGAHVVHRPLWCPCRPTPHPLSPLPLRQ